MKAPENPAEYVISLFGGVRPACRALGLSSATCGYWRRIGYVPIKNIPNILDVCRKQGIKVDRIMLIPR